MESGPGKRGRGETGERERSRLSFLSPPSLSPMLRIRFSAPPLSFGASIKIWKAERGRYGTGGTERNGVSVDVDRRGIRMVREGGQWWGTVRESRCSALDVYRGFDPSIVCGLPPPPRWYLVGAHALALAYPSYFLLSLFNLWLFK